MNAILNLIEQHYDANRDEVQTEIEMRHGQIITADNQLMIQAFTLKGEDFAVGHVDGEAVLFITVNWGDPSVKFSYL